MDSEALSSGERRVRNLVREVIADQAPDELTLLDGLFEVDDDTVVRRLTGHGNRREPLGFGMGEIAVLITPVVWLALDQAARRLVDISVTGTSDRLRQLFRRGRPPVAMPPLTREQLNEVRRLVLEIAGQRGLPAERATAIADAVVTRLALADPAPPDGGNQNPAVGDSAPQE
ncbi:hypothetical protein AB0L80_42925 [Streptomyces sp. NPDC052069]|uniref:hypothetical protein n=1 Tax=Streptomyces sp. NPDC052069 TaxID=3154650 RepID=UPI0034458E95